MQDWKMANEYEGLKFDGLTMRARVQKTQFWGVYTIQRTSSKLSANVFKIHELMLDFC